MKDMIHNGNNSLLALIYCTYFSNKVRMASRTSCIRKVHALLINLVSYISYHKTAHPSLV